ncbi:MAG: hypothetical protein NVS4B8_27580 [Herpetosiphon sp.]
MSIIASVELGMACVLFLVGLVMVVSGFVIIVAKEYQDTLKVLSAQTPKLAGKALTDHTVVAAIDGTARLLQTVTQLIQTAVGVGAFLCLFGVAICGFSFWMAITAGHS